MRRKAARLASRRAAHNQGAIDDRTSVEWEEDVEQLAHSKVNASKPRDSETLQENSRKNYAKRGGKWKESEKRRSIKNQEKRKAQAKTWRLNNPEKIEANRERSNELNRIRRRRKAQREETGG